MSDKHFCQSCSMPMDSPELFGTEKDGSGFVNFPFNSRFMNCYINVEDATSTNNSIVPR